MKLNFKPVIKHELEVLKAIEEVRERIERTMRVMDSDVFELFPQIRQRLTRGRLDCDRFYLETLKAISITHQ